VVLWQAVNIAELTTAVLTLEWEIRFLPALLAFHVLTVLFRIKTISECLNIIP